MNSLIYVQVGVPIAWKDEDQFKRQLTIRTAEGIEVWEMKNKRDVLKGYIWELLEMPCKEESIVRWILPLEPSLDEQAIRVLLNELQEEQRVICFDFKQLSQTRCSLMTREVRVQGYAKSNKYELAIDQQPIEVSPLAYGIWKQLLEGCVWKEIIESQSLDMRSFIQASYELVSARLLILL